MIQFVWIPIADTSKFARVAWTTAYGYDANVNWKSGTCTTPHQFANTSTANRWWDDTTTGKSEYWKANNIYDFPVANRDLTDVSNTYDDVGFRFSFYL